MGLLTGPPTGRPWLTTMFTFMTFFMSFSILYLLFSQISPGVEPPPEIISAPEATIPEVSLPEETKPPLNVSPVNSFKIAIFQDLHYGEEENGFGIQQDVKSTEVMRTILRLEQPSLVIINGDLITGENTFKENASDYVHQIVAPMVESNIPWASTYGNHDSKFNLSREQTFATETSYDLCYTQRMDDKLPGISNYYVLLHSEALKRPVAVLWFFDSRGGSEYQDESAKDQDNIPNWVAPETAAWFKGANAKLASQYGRLHSMVFVHIPPKVFLSAQNSGVDASHYPGVNDDVPLSIQGAGSEDDAFVEALRSVDLLHSVYVGHDHGNAWCSQWPGEHKRHGDDEHEEGGEAHEKRHLPFLCFGKHTGYGGYGKWNRGARILNVEFIDTDGDGDFDDYDEVRVQTWVRMENWDVVTRVMLNETYGTDVYPTENGE